jgi:sugar phosphate isomerase/epimerase
MGLFFFFDIGHSNIGNEDTLQVFKDFHKKIKGISLSNNNGNQDQHLPISTGILNYTDIVKSIIECNWKGLVAFETRGIDTQNTLLELKNIYTGLN